MANSEFPWDEFLPQNWTGFESGIWQDAFQPFETTFFDAHAQGLFDAALFHNNEYTHEEIKAIQQELRDYLQDQYGIDFDDVFDWDAYRENYNEQ